MAARGECVPHRGSALVRALCGAHPRPSGEGSGLRLALGIDAAWTATESSGVALARESADGWRLLAVESSYARFRERAAGREPEAAPRGEPPNVVSLLDACRRLAGRAPDLVAVDMPLALTPIVGRRASDLAISRAFGAAQRLASGAAVG